MEPPIQPMSARSAPVATSVDSGPRNRPASAVSTPGSRTAAGDPRFSRNGQPVRIEMPPPGPKKAIVESPATSSTSGQHAVPQSRSPMSPTSSVHPSRQMQVPMPSPPTSLRSSQDQRPTSAVNGDKDKASFAIPERPDRGSNAINPGPASKTLSPATSSSRTSQQRVVTASPASLNEAAVAAPKSTKPDSPNDKTELSSLAKLRQFKASIAASRAKRPEEADQSDRLAAMATTFLASDSAVPPTPTTILASQLGLPPRPNLGSGDRVASEKSSSALPPKTVAKQAEPSSSMPSTPSPAFVTAPPTAQSVPDSVEGADLNLREQELKSRLKGLKKGGGTPKSAQSLDVPPPPGPTGAERGVSDFKPRNTEKRERPEVGRYCLKRMGSGRKYHLLTRSRFRRTGDKGRRSGQSLREKHQARIQGRNKLLSINITINITWLVLQRWTGGILKRMQMLGQGTATATATAIIEACPRAEAGRPSR